MDPNNKGLADDQQGDFVLNESSTSVALPVLDTDITEDATERQEQQAEPFKEDAPLTPDEKDI